MDFPIRLQPNLRPILRLSGVHPGNAVVRLDDARLVARFGIVGAETPLANIERWDITGPYRWWRAVGVRRTVGTHDLSFGGSAHGGVCLRFRQPVRVGRFRVTDLYLTVDDLAGLGAALTARPTRSPRGPHGGPRSGVGRRRPASAVEERERATCVGRMRLTSTTASVKRPCPRIRGASIGATYRRTL